MILAKSGMYYYRRCVWEKEGDFWVYSIIDILIVP